MLQLYRGDPLYCLDQSVHFMLGQSAMDDYDDLWEASEGYLNELDPETLALLRADIDLLFATYPEPQKRLKVLYLNDQFETPEEYDDWLRIVAERIDRLLAGVNTEPIQRPLGHGPRQD